MKAPISGTVSPAMIADATNAHPMQERINPDSPSPGLSGLTITSPTGEVKSMGLPQFDNFPDAFDYCREVDHPLRALVHGKRFKLYPSGKAVPEPTEEHHLNCDCLRCSYGSEALRILGVE